MKNVLKYKVFPDTVSGSILVLIVSGLIIIFGFSYIQSGFVLLFWFVALLFFFIALIKLVLIFPRSLYKKLIELSMFGDEIKKEVIENRIKEAGNQLPPDIKNKLPEEYRSWFFVKTQKGDWYGRSQKGEFGRLVIEKDEKGEDKIRVIKTSLQKTGQTFVGGILVESLRSIFKKKNTN